MIKPLITIMLLFVACHGQPTGMATDPTNPPFEFHKAGSTDPIGFDIDFVTALDAAKGIYYQVSELPMTSIFEKLAKGWFYFAVSGITINDARKKIYDFSVPYFLSTHKILANEGTDIASAQDLVNKVVAVRNETTGAAAVQKIFGGDSVNILKFSNSSQAIQAVINGQADAYVDDSGILEYYAKNNSGFEVIEDSDVFEKEFYGVMFPKEHYLIDRINEAITTILQNGKYAEIYKKWFGTDPDVNLLLEAGKYEDPYDMFQEIEEEKINEEEDVSEEEVIIVPEAEFDEVEEEPPKIVVEIEQSKVIVQAGDVQIIIQIKDLKK